MDDLRQLLDSPLLTPEDRVELQLSIKHLAASKSSTLEKVTEANCVFNKTAGALQLVEEAMNAADHDQATRDLM